MGRRSELLARLRVCRDADVPVSRDLLQSVIAHLEADADAAQARRARDAYVRRAALMLPDASVWARSLSLAREAKAVGRMRARPVGPGDEIRSVRDALAVAASFHPLPCSNRQFLRIIDVGAGTAANDDDDGQPLPL